MSKSLDRLRASLQRGGATQLAIGPMSVHCVDAVIELANAIRHPLMLIASRRQIECAAHGGGYINGWTTETFARSVRERDKGEYVVLCRDHGGPWQNYSEVSNALPLDAAMQSAKESFRVDIESGFDIIHLDPSIDIHNENVTQDEVQERLFELYAFTRGLADRLGIDIEIEIGTEQQQGDMSQNVNMYKELLQQTNEYCRKQGFPTPLFVVMQTGTVVKGTYNVGVFDAPFWLPNSIPAEIQVPKLVEVCRSYGVYLKEHNADYLSNEALIWHPKLGIHAANIAPEFGVAQTRHILRLCEELGLHSEEEQFLELAHNSGKWKKWMLPDTKATDRDRAIVAGHYVYATEEFQGIMDRIRLESSWRGLDADNSIREMLKTKIMLIMRLFGLC